MKNNKATHYQRLQVSPTATAVQIKAAYHRAARQYHPDKSSSQENLENDDNDDDDFNFRSIQMAWECLRDETTRRNYDEKLRLQSEKDATRRENATILERSDCQGPFVAVEEENETMVWVYTCRCGEELDLVPLEESVVDCHGCSLLYDIRALGEG